MFDFISKKFTELFSKTVSSETINDFVETIHQALLESDVPLHIIHDFTKSVKEELLVFVKNKRICNKEQCMKIVHGRIMHFLGGNSPQSFVFKSPSITMLIGVQGSGKTTTVAKLAAHIKKQEKKSRILVASIDYYRPAAIDQLRVMAEKVLVDFYQAQNSNPIQATQEIYTYFKKHTYDHLIFDTAGRLHLDESMIQELKQVIGIIKPTNTILILDGMTGQESLTIARGFEESIGFQGAILTKMDSDTRGGAAFAFRYAIGKPIMFIGTGEKIDDLQPFYADRIASRMIGSGDLQTLFERSQDKLGDINEQKAKNIFSGNFTFCDYLDQLKMMEKIGSLSSIMKYMPGMAGSVSEAQLSRAEREIIISKAVISSMTQKERLNPAILNESRQKRIALGAGVSFNEVKLLLKRFDEVKQYVKMVKKSGGFGRLFKQ